MTGAASRVRRVGGIPAAVPSYHRKTIEARCMSRDRDKPSGSTATATVRSGRFPRCGRYVLLLVVVGLCAWLVSKIVRTPRMGRPDGFGKSSTGNLPVGIPQIVLPGGMVSRATAARQIAGGPGDGPWGIDVLP